jgi:hypothetical protein
VQIKKQLFFILKSLAHSMRLKLLMLRESNRLTVGELADPCKVRNNVASKYLRLMMRCGFFSFGKKGKKTFYQISEPPIFFMLECIKSRFV